jgi:cold shock CspA family protein
MTDHGRAFPMTGRIKSLDVASGSGVIRAEDGLIVGFCLSAVLAYDIPTLAIGRAVRFDLEDDRYPKALNICVEPVSQAVNAKEKHPQITHLRYIGFEHRGNIRAYLFEGLTPGSEKRTFTVNADLALFARHHVGMQVGPALSLHFLMQELDAEGTAAQASFNCSLSDREMLAHLATLPAPRAKPGFKRAQHATGVTSHVA